MILPEHFSPHHRHIFIECPDPTSRPDLIDHGENDRAVWVQGEVIPLPVRSSDLGHVNPFPASRYGCKLLGILCLLRYAAYGKQEDKRQSRSECCHVNTSAGGKRSSTLALKPGKPSGTEVCAGNIRWRKRMRKSSGGGRKGAQHLLCVCEGRLSCRAFFLKSTISRPYHRATSKR